MKEYSLENIVLSIGVAIFGGLVHIANKFSKAKKMGWADGGALFVTSLFSGFVFALLSILLADILEVKLTLPQLWLSIAVGAVLGWDGLIRVANRATDVILFTLKK